MIRKFVIIICIILFSISLLTAAKFIKIDKFEKLRGWRILLDEGSKGKMKLGKESGKNSLIFDYNLSEGNWVQIYKFLDINFKDLKGLRFVYKTIGEQNSIELKIVDKDGSNFGLKFDVNPFIKGWDEKIITMKELQYMWGGDKDLDLDNVENIYIAIVKNEGGKGKLIISDLSYTKDDIVEEIEKETKEDKDTEKDDSLIFYQSMDIKKAWGLQKDQGIKLNLRLLKGKKGKCFRLDYDFGDGQWFQIIKDVKKDFSGMDTIEFYYKGGDAINNIELKIEDADGSIYGYRMDGASNVPDWEKVVIPFRDLIYFWGGDQKLNLRNIKNISIAISRNRGGKGYICFDEFKVKVKKVLIGDSYSGSVMLDNFEKVNLQSMYFALKKDNSTININSSRLYIKTGNYSMEMEYQLSADKSIPSSVSAYYESDKTLEWKNVSKVNIWVRGDGSGNIFKINLYDQDGDRYTYEDKLVLFANDWKKVSIPLDRFKIPSWWTIKGKKIKKTQKIVNVKSIEFEIAGRTVEKSQGKVYLDNFYAIGEKLLPINVAPNETLEVIKLERPQGNVDIKSRAQVEYKKSEEENHRVSSGAHLGFDAALSKFQVFAELHISDQEFGESAYMDNNRNIENNYPNVESTALKVSAINPFTYVHNITAGNVWVDYSEYTFSQWGWGFKGAQVEGSYDMLHYNLFMIKHKYDSITYGGLFNYAEQDYIAKVIYVQYNQQGKKETAGIANEHGEIISDKDGNANTAPKIIDTVKSIDDSVVTFEISYKFSKKLTARGLVGMHNCKKKAVLNMEDPQNPLFSHYLDEEIETKGYYYRPEIELNNFPLPEFFVNFNVRVSDKNFKPYYRRDAYSFDETKSDVIAYNLYARYSIFGLVPLFNFDIANRKKKDEYYRKIFHWGIDKYNYYGLDLFFHQEYKKQDDRWYHRDTAGDYGSAINLHEEKISHIAKIIYHFSPSLQFLQELRFDYITKPDENNKEYRTIIYYAEIMYYISSTTKFAFFARTTKEGTGIDGHDSPHEDNFYKMLFEVSF